MKLRDAIAARKWRDKLISAEQAIALIPPAAVVYIGGGCAVPETMVRALEKAAPERPYLRLLHHMAILASGPFSPALRHRSMMVGPHDVALTSSGRAQYLPIMACDIPNSLSDGRMQVNVAIVQVSPPDALGMCSLGISVGVALAVIERADVVIAEVNSAMPHVRGHALLPVTTFDAMVEGEPVLAEYQPPQISNDPQRVARYVARLVTDGCTLHVAAGDIPTKVLEFLHSRRDLGVHTDVVTDAVVDLIDAGVITGREKSSARGRVVASLAMGTQKLYDRVADEKLFSLQPLEQVTNDETMLQQHQMVSIAQAFAADLTGQVCTEVYNGELYGGVGSIPQFHWAAARSPQGRAIICLPSLDSHGRSAIRARLDRNEAVTIPRFEVRWVVTEFGAAYLHSKTLSERAVAMIEIAHPEHRAALLSEAKRNGLVPPDQKMRSRRDYPIKEMRTITLHDDSEVLLRPTMTTDASLLQLLFYELKPEDVYTRFFRKLSSLTRQAAEHLCSVGYEEEMAFAAVLGDEESGRRIIASSSYFVDAETGLADVAYMVSPEFQGQGLGTALHLRTVEYAMQNGVRGFSADILEDNPAMLAVFARGPGTLKSRTVQGTYEIELLFAH